jgi:phage terminase large subunit-like protein
MFSEAHAEYTCSFIECLKHGDDFYGEPFELIDWQRQAVSEFYGTLKDNGYRQYQYLYLEIPKKNGKSELSAALGLYHTFADGAQKGEVYIVAADRQNASIVFEAALSMLDQCPTLNKRAIRREAIKEIVDRVTGTKMKVLSAEAYSKHGYKPSCVIFDELHAQRDRRLWDVMTFGAGSARKQPVWIVLTTAGDDPDKNSIGWEVHEKARNILNFRQGKGGVDNPIWLPFIYGMPDDPDECKKIDIFDEKLWGACNPSLGHTVSIETLRQEALEARHNENAERLFRWLRLNQWIAVKSVGWLPLTLFDKTEIAISREKLRGLRCYAGLDLSSTTDLTALVLLFPPQGDLKHWFTLFHAWIPEDMMRERSLRDHVDFESWVKKGYVKATPGDCIDYDYVEEEILKAKKEYEIKMLGADQWNSRMLTQHLAKEGIKVVEIPQTIAGMSPAMKEIERTLRNAANPSADKVILETDLMAHEKNPCARWCFGNVRCKGDGNENLKPMKNLSTGRIDTTVAWIDAMAAYMLDDDPDINEIIEEGWTL